MSPMIQIKKNTRLKIADINIIYITVFVPCYLWQKLKTTKQEPSYFKMETYSILIDNFLQVLHPFYQDWKVKKRECD